ncbi:hypothetical protein [Paenibacillus faecalis]|uniref:hypothetical protein n=1 Tax=Paenibacillus faecalis TaxID=2079532 RepID=UPI000D0FA27D|nr:hypothetical protein [Paenibacillus faecalis]
MSQFMKLVGGIIFGGGIILGIVFGLQESEVAKLLKIEEGFRWMIALTWWIGGIISGSIFFTIGSILEIVQENSARLKELLHRSEPTITGGSIGNTKSDLSSLKGYTMKKVQD